MKRQILETPIDVLKMVFGILVIVKMSEFVGQGLIFPYAGPIFMVSAMMVLAIENVVYNQKTEDIAKNGGWLWLEITLREPWNMKQPVLVTVFGLCGGIMFALLYAALDAASLGVS